MGSRSSFWLLISFLALSLCYQYYHHTTTRRKFYDRIKPSRAELGQKEVVEPTYDDWNCEQLFLGNETALATAERWTNKATFTDEQIMKIASVCSIFLHSFFFPTVPNSVAEKEFPLAYVILVQRNPEQVIRLLQAIYWPQNVYCLTYDNKASEFVKKTVENLAKCFKGNVFLAPKHVKIYWGHYSVLQAALICLKALHQSKFTWKYVQIVSWSDYPLKTNGEMVQIFKVLNGSNDAELKRADPERYRNPAWFLPDTKTIPEEYAGLEVHKLFNGHWIVNRSVPRPPPPGNLMLFKGSFQASLSREFATYLLEKDLPKEFRKWTRETFIPDELYLPTLIHNSQIPDIPGTYSGRCLAYYESRASSKPWISRYDLWDRHRCGGKMVRKSCVFGVRDLRKLKVQRQLMAHKFYLEYQPAAYQCLEELHQNRTRFGRGEDDEKFEIEAYETLPGAQFQRLTPEEKLDWKCWMAHQSSNHQRTNQRFHFNYRVQNTTTIN